MARPKRKRKRVKRRGKLKVSQKTRIIRKDSDAIDTLSQVPVKRIIPDNGATFKIRLRKKTK